MDTASREEFRQYVAARSAGLLRTATLLTGDPPLAEDLVRTALARTYLGWGRIRDREAVDADTRRILVTTYATWWRRRWRGETPTERLPPDLADRVERAARGIVRRRMAAGALAIAAVVAAPLAVRATADPDRTAGPVSTATPSPGPCPARPTVPSARPGPRPTSPGPTAATPPCGPPSSPPPPGPSRTSDRSTAPGSRAGPRSTWPSGAGGRAGS